MRFLHSSFAAVQRLFARRFFGRACHHPCRVPSGRARAPPVPRLSHKSAIFIFETKPNWSQRSAHASLAQKREVSGCKAYGAAISRPRLPAEGGGCPPSPPSFATQQHQLCSPCTIGKRGHRLGERRTRPLFSKRLDDLQSYWSRRLEASSWRVGRGKAFFRGGGRRTATSLLQDRGHHCGGRR